MALPQHLPNLTTREAIADIIYRATEAYDTNDFDMLASALTSDVVFELDGQIMSGLDTLKTSNFNWVGAMDTTHFVTNVRVHVENDTATTATATANALAQHYPTGKGNSGEGKRLLVGARYFIDAVKDEKDGLWRAKKWALKVVWREGDGLVMVPESS